MHADESCETHLSVEALVGSQYDATYDPFVPDQACLSRMSEIHW